MILICLNGQLVPVERLPVLVALAG